MKFRILAPVVLAVLTGCAAERELSPFDTLSHRNPVDPDLETSTKPYHSVVAGYHPRTVVEPKPWADTATDVEKQEGNQ